MGPCRPGLHRSPGEVSTRVTSWLGRYRGRLAVEIVLAAAAGVAAFVLTVLVCVAARSHVPAVVLGPLLLLAVLAVARLAGILYALPVGVATVLAFDWYFLPPLRDLDTATELVLGLFLAMSVIVGALATTASRRAIASEHARGAIAEEQSALRRVATLVAQAGPPSVVFEAVTREVGLLCNADVARMERYEADGSDRRGRLEPGAEPVRRAGRGDAVHLDGLSIARGVQQTGGPVRVDGFGTDTGADRPGGAGGGDPLLGRLPDRRGWPAVGSDRGLEEARGAVPGGHRGPDRQVHRAGRHRGRERAGSRGAACARRRAGGTAAGGDVGRRDGAACRCVRGGRRGGGPAARRRPGAHVPVRARRHRERGCRLEPTGRPPGGRITLSGLQPSMVTALVRRTGQPARTDTYPPSSPLADEARRLGVRSTVGCPITVEGRLWG